MVSLNQGVRDRKHNQTSKASALPCVVSLPKQPGMNTPGNIFVQAQHANCKEEGPYILQESKRVSSYLEIHCKLILHLGIERTHEVSILLNNI